MSHYKPYPAYKDSGVEWLGKVPEHWVVKPIKSLANIPGTCFIDGDWIESKNLSGSGIRYITTGNVGPGTYKEQGSGYISEETFSELQCIDVCQGDILMSRLNPPIGRACIVPDLGGRVVTSVDNVIFRPSQEYLSKYVVYRFTAADYFHEMGLLASGATMQRISRTELGNVRVAWPSLNEQKAIAVHLNRETARIDALITKKTRFIELLREKRQALITHAVTKGLDPNVKMKDSGVEWLGEVPEHWGIQRLRYAVTLNPAIQVGLRDSQMVTFLPMEAIGEEGSIDTQRSKQVGEVKAGYSYFENGDVAFAKVTPCFENGKGAVMQGLIDGVGFGTTELTVLRPKSKVLAKFLDLLVRSHNFRAFGEGAMTGAGGLKRVPDEFTRNFVIALPCVDEQSKILSAVVEIVDRIDGLMLKSERSIELLKERRSALITAAVTGQIDLREAA
jgi:type I restriction enzyme, S subunit